MQITLVQGLLIALLVFICAIDKHMETFMWFRPLVVAFFTGIILGDVQLGMQAGAVAELSYLGLLTVGGTVPPDPLFAGLMTTVLAYTTGCDVNTALGLAVPFALIGQWINTGTNTFYAGFLPKVDKCAAAGDEKGIAKVMYTGWILYAAMFALAAFLSTYALQSGISAFVAAERACACSILKTVGIRSYSLNTPAISGIKLLSKTRIGVLTPFSRKRIASSALPTPR